MRTQTSGAAPTRPPPPSLLEAPIRTQPAGARALTLLHPLTEDGAAELRVKRARAAEMLMRTQTSGAAPSRPPPPSLLMRLSGRNRQERER